MILLHAITFTQARGPSVFGEGFYSIHVQNWCLLRPARHPPGWLTQNCKHHNKMYTVKLHSKFLAQKKELFSCCGIRNHSHWLERGNSKILQLHVCAVGSACLLSSWCLALLTRHTSQALIHKHNLAYAPLSLRDGGRRNMLMRSSTPCSSKQYFLSCGEKKVEVISKVDHTKIWFIPV